MATTTRKGSDNKKAKPRGPMVNTLVAEQAQTIGELRQQLAEALEREKTALKKLQDHDQQLGEALEQQTGTSAIHEDSQTDRPHGAFLVSFFGKALSNQILFVVYLSGISSGAPPKVIAMPPPSDERKMYQTPSR